MKILKLSAVIFFFTILSGLTNQLQAQPEFATVRLVTSWSKSSVLFVSKGSGEIEEFEMKQKYIDIKNQKLEFNSDNKVINSTFATLYSEGYKLISTSSTNTNTQREIIFLLVKE